MDRLSFVAALVITATAVACSDDAASSRGSRERVNAVKAKPHQQVDPAEMCDLLPPVAQAPTFAWPKLSSAPPAARAGEWRWINVWATWCKPCVKELPHLAKWRRRLIKHDIGVALHLISADESAEEIASFRRAHPKTPASMRLADPDDLSAWMTRLGISGVTLPVHVFVDPEGRVRCVRASEIGEADYPFIEALMR